MRRQHVALAICAFIISFFFADAACAAGVFNRME